MFVAHFYKVSKEQYLKNHTEKSFTSLKLPQRATSGSAGYDFFLPEDLIIPAQENVFVFTGIKVKIKVGWVLVITPRSGLGFKYGLSLMNTVGIIDNDYYDTPENEGEIILKLKNNSTKELKFGAQTKICQGILLKFGLAYEEARPFFIRKGGIGSSDLVKN